MSDSLNVAMSIAGQVILPALALLISVYLSTRLYKKERQDALEDRIRERQEAMEDRIRERQDAIEDRFNERMELRLGEMVAALSAVSTYDPETDTQGPVIKELRIASNMLGNLLYEKDQDLQEWSSRVCIVTELLLSKSGPYYEVKYFDDGEEIVDHEGCNPDHPEAKYDERALDQLQRWSELVRSLYIGWHRLGHEADYMNERTDSFAYKWRFSISGLIPRNG